MDSRWLIVILLVVLFVAYCLSRHQEGFSGSVTEKAACCREIGRFLIDSAEQLGQSLAVIYNPTLQNLTLHKMSSEGPPLKSLVSSQGFTIHGDRWIDDNTFDLTRAEIIQACFKNAPKEA